MASSTCGKTMAYDLEQTVGRMFYVLNLIAGKYARRILGPYDVSREQLFCLGTLITSGDGISQAELAQRLYVDKSSVARMLVVLEQKGLVRREPVPGNLRANTILLTDKAPVLWDSIMCHVWGWEEILLDGFSQLEVRNLITILQRMETNATEAQKNRASIKIKT